MSTIFWISLSVNSLMVMVLIHHARMFAVRSRALHEHRQTLELERRQINQERDRHREMHMATAAAIGRILSGIRHDINDNYRHLHDRHLLDSLVYAFEVEARRGYCPSFEAVIPIEIASRVNGHRADANNANGVVTFAEALDFGWGLHVACSERARGLLPVVRQPCGTYADAVWLAKTLAIYEQMCHGNVDLAATRLDAVVQAWRKSPSVTYAASVADDVVAAQVRRATHDVT